MESGLFVAAFILTAGLLWLLVALLPVPFKISRKLAENIAQEAGSRFRLEPAPEAGRPGQ